MAFLEVSFPGEAIGLASSMNVIVPNSGQGPFPVFYLLHGLSDDHTIWHRRTSIERYVEGLPLMVVMPATARAWYTNGAAAGIGRYEDHIIKDVVGTVDRLFPTIKGRRGRAIGGLSMGGYGAVKLGLKHFDKFCSINSHSGALTPFDLLVEKPKPEMAAFVAEMRAVFGKEHRGSGNDPAVLARKCPKKLRPALRFDCGTEDFLLEENRDFAQHLDKIGYPHEYQEFPGAHTWGYWDQHVQEAIAFHCKVLGIKLPTRQED